jgi:hypothetical protein
VKDTTRFLLLALAALVAATPTLRAHTGPPRLTVYVKPLGDRVRVLVRVPTALLADRRLPVRADGYFDLRTGLDRSARSMNGITSDVVRNLDLMSDGRVPAPPAVAWTISPASDRSFETFEGAEARATTLPPDEARIDPTEALLDLQLDYPLPMGARRLSVRVNGYRGTQGAETAVHYLSPSGETRTMVTSGAPRRLELEPGRGRVASEFGRLGLEQLTLSAIHLMFVLCLAIPARSMRLALRLFGWFAGSWALAVAASALLPESWAAARATLIQAMAAAALAVAGLQNVVAPRLPWVQAVAAAFGILDGLAIGVVYRQSLQFAGAFPAVAFVSFLLPILLGSLWLLLVAHPVVAIVRRSRLPERWATALLSAIPIHAALHGMIRP